MEFPSVIHPKRIKIGDYVYEVVSYSALTDEQAAQIARLSHRMRPPKKKDRSKVIQVYSTADPD